MSLILTRRLRRGALFVSVLAPAMLISVSSGAMAQDAAAPAAPAAPQPRPVEAIRSDAAALAPFAKSAEAKRFLAAAADLPEIELRVVYVNDDFTVCHSEEDALALPEEERATLKRRELGESFYYNTRYGSPLAYVRALDLVFGGGGGEAPLVERAAGARILDYGYGGVGHLRLLASLGADVVGVEVDPLLPVFYGEPGDTGKIAPSKAAAAARGGSVALLHGRYPAEAEVTEAVGDGYDLVISKNTLKNGYINPEREVSNPRMLVDLGVEQEAFVANAFRILKPGGVMIIYNLSPAPAPADKPYIPWADGRSPFSREMWEKAGFEVVAFDEDDNAAGREMAKLLRWDQGARPMDLETQLFVMYTIVRKPRAGG